MPFRLGHPQLFFREALQAEKSKMVITRITINLPNFIINDCSKILEKESP